MTEIPLPDLSALPERALALGLPSYAYRLDLSVYQREAAIGGGQVMLGLVGLFLGINAALHGLWWALAAGLVMCVGLLYVGLYHTWTILKEWRVTTLIARNGLVRLRGSRVTLVRWRDIASITADHHHSRNATLYFLRLHDGRGYNYFDNSPKRIIGETIQYRHGSELFPKVLAALDAGESQRFGVVLVSPQGISAHERHFAWAEIHRYELRNGMLNLYARFQWHTLATTNEIENVMLVLGLIEYATKHRKRSSNGKQPD